MLIGFVERFKTVFVRNSVVITYPILVFLSSLLFMVIFISLDNNYFTKTDQPLITVNLLLVSIIVSSVIAFLGIVMIMSYKLAEITPSLARKHVENKNLEQAYKLKGFLRNVIVILFILSVILIVINSLNPFIINILALITMVFWVSAIKTRRDILTKREEAYYFLDMFSKRLVEALEIEGKLFPSPLLFNKGFKAFYQSLPSSSKIPMFNKRIQQVQLLLTFGEKDDLSKLAKYISEISKALNREYLSGYEEAYKQFTKFLNNFERKVKAIVELEAIVPRSEKIRKRFDAILNTIIEKVAIWVIFTLIAFYCYDTNRSTNKNLSYLLFNNFINLTAVYLQTVFIVSLVLAPCVFTS
jgi:hypothetical protein